MKSIEINQDQRNKLLEMCKYLFPEMDAYTIEDTEESDGMILGFWGQSTNGVSIHWFEFCMTHLNRKIDKLYIEKEITPLEKRAFNENNYPDGLPKNWTELWEYRPYMQIWKTLNLGQYKIHPIDYLYEEFLKLK